MKKCFLIIALTIFITSCSKKIYVVRHAEKAAQPASNPELSADGTQRAIALREALKNKNIKGIYSTNTTRTLNTALPLSQVTDTKTEIYPSRPDSSFIHNLKKKSGNQLVVGHSNTIDDIVNMLCGRIVVPADLPDAAYDNLYIVRLPRSGKGAARFKNLKYGKSTPVESSSASPAMN